jgi:hypothetical protein
MPVWIAHRPGGPRADRYFLSGQTVTADGFARAEINTGLLAYQVLAAEASAGAHTEATMLAELLAQPQRDATPTIEALGSAILDARALTEWPARQVGDGIAPAESAATQREGATVPAESLSNARGDASGPVAFSATQIGDSRDPLENLGANSVLGDEFVPLEGLAGQQRDSNKPAEALAGPRSNAGSLAEALGTQRSEADPTTEALTGQRADALLLIEPLTRALRDTNTPFESAGSAALVRDQFVALEFPAGQRSDPEIPTAWLVSIPFDGRAPTEFIATAAGGTITSDALAVIELLAGQAADALASAESAASSRRDTVNQAEVLARAVRDASPQIETLGQAAAFVDVFLAVEAGCDLDIGNIFTCENLISAAGTSFAVLDSWITPIIQIASGRLLKPVGKIRILTMWKQ